MNAKLLQISLLCIAPLWGGDRAADLMNLGRYGEACELLQKTITSNPNSGQGSQAIRVCERALEVHPDSARLDEFYVSVLRRVCPKPERKAKLVRRLQRNPDAPVSMMALSELLLAEDPVGLEAQIEPLVRKAALARPLDPEAHYLYGQWACLNDRHDVSVRELTKALELIRNNDRARMQTYTYLGITYERMQQAARAEEAFRTAVAINRPLPTPEPGTFMQYAKFLQDEQRESEAQTVLQEVLRIAPSFGPAHLERAKFLAAKDRADEALAEGELALKYAGADLLPQRAAHAFLARTLHALGRTEQAKAHQQWVEAHPR